MTALRGRGDVHSPANFNPENYEWVGAFDNALTDSVKGADGLDYTFDVALSERANELISLLAKSLTAPYGTGYQCDHCGAHIRYVGVFRHVPTGDHIAAGQVCVDNRFPLSKVEFDRLRKDAELAREQHRCKVAWEIFKSGHPEVDWDLLTRLDQNHFIVDVLRKGRRYGYLTDRQVSAIAKAGARDIEWAWDAALREETAEVTPTVPVPEGKGIVITGKLASRKWKETQWGSVEKCLVVVTTPDGEYKVWGSIPQSLYNLYDKGEIVQAGAKIGDVITFTANVEPSEDDEAFGFFSRPRKASVVERGDASESH